MRRHGEAEGTAHRPCAALMELMWALVRLQNATVHSGAALSHELTRCVNESQPNPDPSAKNSGVSSSKPDKEGSMNYHMEPIEDMKLCDFTIELEVGGGIGRKLANVSDLTQGKVTKLPNGFLSVKGGGTLTLPLDEEPGMATARETAEEIALALLEAKAKVLHSPRRIRLQCGHGFKFVPDVTPASPWLNQKLIGKRSSCQQSNTVVNSLLERRVTHG